MDAAIIDQLVCPVCATRLELRLLAEANGAVDEAILLCRECSAWFPVTSGVPVLLDFETPLHRAFATRRGRELSDLDGFRPPAGKPRPGEESTQTTFTEEWTATQESGLSFAYSLDDLERLTREVWLKWLDSPDRGLVARVLNLGCGLGSETLGLRTALGGGEIFAVDLNLGLLGSRSVRESPPDVHFILASLFALPLRKSSFDLVFSQGVLHHTFSAEQAFAEAASYVAPGGYLFVWLYTLEDPLVSPGKRGAAMRAAVALQRIVRPPVSRAPEAVRNAFFAVATSAAHPLLKPRMRHAAEWERANTETYLRDWLSPRYAHRHGFNEVIEWFENLGFAVVDLHSPRAYRRLFGYPLWGIGITGRRAGGD